MFLPTNNVYSNIETGVPFLQTCIDVTHIQCYKVCSYSLLRHDDFICNVVLTMDSIVTIMILILYVYNEYRWYNIHF